MKSIIDGAEVSVDFPDRVYVGTFGRRAGFEVKVGDDEAMLRLVRDGDERCEATVHLHHYLLANVLSELAACLEATNVIDEAHREPLQAAAKALVHALRKRR